MTARLPWKTIRDENRSLAQENLRLLADVRRLSRVEAEKTAQLNQNNRLWNALASLPGGLELARKLTG